LERGREAGETKKSFYRQGREERWGLKVGEGDCLAKEEGASFPRGKERKSGSLVLGRRGGGGGGSVLSLLLKKVFRQAKKRGTGTRLPCGLRKKVRGGEQRPGKGWGGGKSKNENGPASSEEEGGGIPEKGSKKKKSRRVRREKRGGARVGKKKKKGVVGGETDGPEGKGGVFGGGGKRMEGRGGRGGGRGRRTTDKGKGLKDCLRNEGGTLPPQMGEKKEGGDSFQKKKEWVCVEKGRRKERGGKGC